MKLFYYRYSSNQSRPSISSSEPRTINEQSNSSHSSILPHPIPPTTYHLPPTKNGFSAVELLITLFIAAAFMISGYQLYAVVLKDGGEARMNARAANAATDYLQQYKSNIAVKNPCSSSDPLVNATPSPAITGLSNVTVSVSITCPYVAASPSTAGCTGGDSVTYDGLYTVHKFTAAVASTLNCPITTNAAILVVGGGGGGISGGGGGGGYIYNSSYTITPQTYTVTVGSNGVGGVANGGAGGTNGGNSIFSPTTGTAITAIGGGHGGQNDTTSGATTGGSGGGGGATSTVQTNGGSGTTGQGYSGGTVTSSYYATPYPSAGGGGGGGIGSNPTGASTSGNGGIGISNNISGSILYYSGGGGGSTWSNGIHGLGGSGVGGNGGYPNGTVGVANSGSGGGGGAGGGGGSGGSGGSGIVIVRYLTPTGATNATSKITVTLKYGTPQQTIANSTYVGFTPIVTNGLVLNLDAANSASYPGTGTTWADLSGLGNNGTLIGGFGVGGLGYSTDNGGSLTFDGGDDYVSIGTQNIVGTGTSPLTGQLWIYNTKNWTNGQYSMPIRIKHESEFILDMYNPSGTLNIYPAFRGYTQWGTPVTQSDFVNKWVSLTFVYNGGDKSAASSFLVYVNGVQIPSGTNNYGLAGGASNCNIIGVDGNSGCNSTAAGLFQGKISSYSLYNRALSATEITQNFNALRSRYGL